MSKVKQGSYAIVIDKTDPVHTFYIGQKVNVIWIDDMDAFCSSVSEPFLKQFVSLNDLEPYEKANTNI